MVTTTSITCHLSGLCVIDDDRVVRGDGQGWTDEGHGQREVREEERLPDGGPLRQSSGSQQWRHRGASLVDDDGTTVYRAHGYASRRYRTVESRRRSMASAKSTNAWHRSGQPATSVLRLTSGATSMIWSEGGRSHSSILLPAFNPQLNGCSSDMDEITTWDYGPMERELLCIVQRGSVPHLSPWLYDFISPGDSGEDPIADPRECWNRLLDEYLGTEEASHAHEAWPWSHICPLLWCSHTSTGKNGKAWAVWWGYWLWFKSTTDLG